MVATIARVGGHPREFRGRLLAAPDYEPGASDRGDRAPLRTGPGLCSSQPGGGTAVALLPRGTRAADWSGKYENGGNDVILTF